MKTLTRITLAALAALLCARAASAQGPDAWVEVAPEGEGFVARMPKPPASRPERARAGGLSVSGMRYAAAGDDQTTYLVWSLNDPAGVGAHLTAQGHAGDTLGSGVSLYLDQVAELAWELLITPEAERLKRENAPAERWANVGMIYRRGFELDGRPAREYLVGLEKARGLAYVCAEGPRVYVVAALGPEAQAEQLKQFVESFNFRRGDAVGDERRRPDALPPATVQVDPTLIKPDPRDTPYGLPNPSATPPSSGPGTGGGDVKGNVGGGPGGDAPVDYNRPFKQSEVTRKAIITFKPEPGFTEGARKFQVTGVVRLRAILAATGEVTGISVVKGLPHGLTERAVVAARQTRFTPAQKDGRAVSQYVVFEYNFNIY